MLGSIFFKKDNVVLELEKLQIRRGERDALLNLLYEVVEYKLMNFVMLRLDEKDKKIFIDYLQTGSREIFIEFLRDKTNNFEQTLAECSKELEMEFLEDIKSLQGNK